MEWKHLLLEFFTFSFGGELELNELVAGRFVREDGVSKWRFKNFLIFSNSIDSKYFIYSHISDKYFTYFVFFFSFFVLSFS